MGRFRFIRGVKPCEQAEVYEMLVLSLNSKRQRRPNVRLAEIGDASAAISSKSSVKRKMKLEERRWDEESNKVAETFYQDDLFDSGSFVANFSEHWVCTKASAGDQSWENWNADSEKYDLEVARDDVFSMLHKKKRMKKQMRWSMRSSGLITSGWHSRVSPEVSNKNEKAYGCDNSYDHSFNTQNSFSAPEDFEGHLSEKVCNNVENAQERYLNDSLPANLSSERNGIPLNDNHEIGNKKHIQNGSNLVNGVREWLEELGFGKYAGIFEMHEVDEEALPLLSYEDLKEMGIIAVGARRRILNAIQHLYGNSEQ